jgi:hypothetical protein
MEKKKRRQKSCGEIALTRARRARRRKMNPIRIGWVFIAALLSIRSSISSPAMPHLDDAGHDWPISDYERGFSTSPTPRCERYSEQPTMKRLLRDVQRPAAQNDALQLLLARIDNITLRGWVLEQIHEDRVSRLLIHARPHLPDTAVIALWQAELDTENIADDEAINDASQEALSARNYAALDSEMGRGMN